MPDSPHNDDVLPCLGTPKPYHLSDATLQAMREAEASGRRLVIIDKGKSYVPLKAMFGEGSTQIQVDRSVVINPNEVVPSGRVD